MFCNHLGENKFSPRVKKSIYLGNSTTQKDYILFDVSQNKTLVNRNVTFYEEIFLLQKEDNSNSNDSPLRSSDFEITQNINNMDDESHPSDDIDYIPFDQQIEHDEFEENDEITDSEISHEAITSINPNSLVLPEGKRRTITKPKRLNDYYCSFATSRGINPKPLHTPCRTTSHTKSSVLIMLIF